MTKTWLSSFVFVFCSATSSHALAHDPPAGNGVFEQGSRLLVRTNRGLVLSEDGKSNFKLLCNEALGINTSEVPSIVALDSGEWLVGTSHGAMIASEDFCSLTPVESLDAVAIPALARDPNDAARIFASTGQAEFDNALYLSDDGAKSFSVHSETDQNRLYDRVLVSASDAMKMYASGLRRKDGVAGFITFFAVSDDGGAHFTEHELTLHDDEYALELLGAHPTQLKTVFGVAHADLGTGVKDRFLKSTDDAATFEEALSVDKLEAFAIAPDGKTLFVGARDGLWRSTDGASTFTRAQDSPVHCLAYSGTKLLVCDDRDGDVGLSVSEDSGATLTRIMKFTQVAAMISCPANATVQSTCSMPWSDWQRELAFGFSLDGGVVSRMDAGNDAGITDSGHMPVLDDTGVTPPTLKKDSGCSCSAVGSGESSRNEAASFAVFVLATTCFVRKRSAKRTMRA